MFPAPLTSNPGRPTVYDAIVVGARCAGAPTAMLLARRGYRVLLLDRSTFPSDTISTHIVWPTGAARLQAWGLLDRVLASGCPEIRRVSFDMGPISLSGSPPPVDGVSTVLAPRRTILDTVLVDAAREAGAEVREHCSVSEIVREGERVTGVRFREGDGATLTESARIVVGADGRNSLVARAVDATAYNTRTPYTCWYYAYWSGVGAEGIEFVSRPGRGIAAIPTNDELVCIPVVWTADEFHEFRSDIECNYLRTIDDAPDLSERVRRGRREGRFFGMADLQSFFRRSHGPGWALVGDAAYHKDPITGQGISDALRGAEALACALDEGFSGRAPLADALARYERERDESAAAMYEMTCDWATLAPPPPEMGAFFAALVGNQLETDRFVGALAGTVPIPEFYAPENVERVIAGGAALAS
jgi:flavin-dependent dehydrogenase